MIDDPVVEEVRARGRALSQRYYDDPAALLRRLHEEAEAHPGAMVDTIAIVSSSREESPPSEQ